MFLHGATRQRRLWTCTLLLTLILNDFARDLCSGSNHCLELRIHFHISRFGDPFRTMKATYLEMLLARQSSRSFWKKHMELFLGYAEHRWATYHRSLVTTGCLCCLSILPEAHGSGTLLCHTDEFLCDLYLAPNSCRTYAICFAGTHVAGPCYCCF